MRAIDWFLKGLDRGRDAVFFADLEGREVTYGAMDAFASRVAQTLAPISAAPHVAILSPNDPRAFGCMLGAWRAGGAWVPLNARNAEEANVAFVKLADVDCLFYHPDFVDQAHRIQRASSQIKRIFSFDAISGDDGGDDDLPPDSARTVAIFPTGGTTGASKAAQLSELCWSLMCATALHIMPYAGRPVHLIAAPMTHAAGGFAAVQMAQGAKNIVLQKFEARTVLRAIEAHKVSHLFLPPAALYALLAEPDVREFDFSSLRYFMVGAAPVSPRKLAEAVSVFGPVMCQQWGQAEAPFFLTWISPEQVADACANPARAHRLASCGVETPLSRVTILPESGAEPLPRRVVGEMAMRGAMRMDEYYKDPGATKALREPNGWQRTGDLGYCDEDGFFYIVDRKRDMIISGGFNVFSVEVEAALNAHPCVETSAVFGVPDERWGEAVKAAVQLKRDHAASAEQLIEHCRGLLGSVKAPKSIDFHEELPRSPAGKVLKRALRDAYWGHLQRRVN